MSYTAHSEIYRGYEIKITQDDDYIDPRNEFDSVTMGRLICFHGEYNLGDKHTKPYEKDASEFRDWILRHHNKDIIALSVWLYDHSGLMLCTAKVDADNPFIGNAQHAAWDSGLLGYIYVTHETVRNDYSLESLSKKDIKKMLNCLKGEVEIYNHYLSGNVWGYEIYGMNDSDKIIPIDAVGGYWGDWDADGGCLEGAKNTIDSLIESYSK